MPRHSTMLPPRSRQEEQNYFLLLSISALPTSQHTLIGVKAHVFVWACTGAAAIILTVLEDMDQVVAVIRDVNDAGPIDGQVVSGVHHCRGGRSALPGVSSTRAAGAGNRADVAAGADHAHRTVGAIREVDVATRVENDADRPIHLRGCRRPAVSAVA